MGFLIYSTCVIVTIVGTLALSKQIIENRLLASLIIGTFIWCLGALIPAAFGVLNSTTVVATTILLAAGALVFGARLVAPPPQPIRIAGSRWQIAVLAVTCILAVTGIFTEPRFN